MLYLEIDVAAIVHNIKLIRERTNAEVSAVIKANCYGLGLELASYMEEYVDSFSVSTISEAMEARNRGIDKKIYILGGINPDDFLLSQNFIYTVCSVDDVYFLLSRIDESSERKINNGDQLRNCIGGQYSKNAERISVALKINTGMNRLGAEIEKAESILQLIRESKCLHLDSIFSHLYNASGGSHYLQFERFERVTSIADKLFTEKDGVKKHLCASNCLGVDSSFHLDMVRCGLAIYGYGYEGLNPSLKAYSNVSQINHVKSGEFVGYGSFRVESDMDVAVLRAGYADGYRRTHKQQYASYKGQLVKVVGQVSMDMIAVDVTGMNCSINDKVYLIDEVATLELLSAANDTIPYEIITALSGGRIRRKYFNVDNKTIYF